MKALVRKSETPPYRSAFRGNERRLATQQSRRRILSLAAGAAALSIAPRIVPAQTYPSSRWYWGENLPEHAIHVCAL